MDIVAATLEAIKNGKDTSITREAFQSLDRKPQSSTKNSEKPKKKS